MQVWRSDIDLVIDWKKYFVIVKLIYNGLNKKRNIPENLQSNVGKKNITQNFTHANENILVQAVYLKKTFRIPFDLPKYGK